MGWKVRAALLGFGLLLIFFRRSQLHAGHWAWSNWYGQTIFAAGLIGVGVFFCALALLPDGDWVYRRITTGRRSKQSNARRGFF